MRLYNYNDFKRQVNESKGESNIDSFPFIINNNQRELKKLRDEFKKNIISVTDINEYSYYSKLASNSSNVVSDDFDKIQSKLDDLGFRIDFIKILFSKDVNDITGESFMEFTRKINSINGYVDIYLFKLNEKLNLGYYIKLGGDRYNDNALLDTGDPGNEVLMKYAYGFHKTDYGKLLLKQKGYSPEEFVEETFIQLKRNIVFEISLNIFSEFIFRGNDVVKHLKEYFDRVSFEIFLENHITTDDDKLIFEIEEFYDELFDKFKISEDFYEKSKEFILQVMYVVNNNLSRSFNIKVSSNRVIFS